MPTIKDKERHYARFLEIFKKVNITIPFSKALKLMLVYSKFMKDLLTKKKSIKDEGIMTLQTNYSVILQKNLPTKLRDLGSFTIHITIRNLSIGRAFLDLGANINLMSFSMLEEIGNMEVKETHMIIQLADCSIRIFHVVVENMLINVGKFTLPIDFVIMDIVEDLDISLILGRPFMNIANTIISVA